MSSQRAKSRETVSIPVFHRDQRLAHDLDVARDVVLLDVFELAQDEVAGRGPGSEHDQRGG